MNRDVINRFLTDRVIDQSREPLDFFTSEDASATLLEAMGTLTLSREDLSSNWVCTTYLIPDYRFQSTYNSDRKTAIIKSALKLWGYAPESVKSSNES